MEGLVYLSELFPLLKFLLLFLLGKLVLNVQKPVSPCLCFDTKALSSFSVSLARKNVLINEGIFHCVLDTTSQCTPGQGLK